MVGTTGFEPATSASRTQRSTKLSYVPTFGGLSLETKPAYLGEQVISGLIGGAHLKTYGYVREVPGAPSVWFSH